METERIALSQRDRDRLRVLHEVKQKHLTQVEAAKRLGVTARHVRRLLWAVGERGDAAMVHGLRGRLSNRKLANVAAAACRREVYPVCRRVLAKTFIRSIISFRLTPYFILLFSI